MMKYLASILLAFTAITMAQAQKVVIYPKLGDAVTYNMSDLDHLEFIPADDADNPVDKDVIVKELWCNRGELKIFGKMYRPAGVADTQKLPAVILSHSANLNADAMNVYATAIAKAGFCAYAFDFCGACDKSRSDGNTADMTPFTEVDDLKAVIAAMKANDGVDASKICLLGSSLGGLVSALTAEDASLGIAGLILFYPAFNIPELVAMMDKFGDMGGGFGDLGGFGMSYSEAFCNSMRNYDVYANIGTFAHKVLILHGSNDIIVKISYSEQAVDTYPDATLITIDGANHGFNADNLGSFGSMMGGTADYDSQVIPHVISYLDSYLR